jgi:hypothetical protein
LAEPGDLPNFAERPDRLDTIYLDPVPLAREPCICYLVESSAESRLEKILKKKGFSRTESNEHRHGSVAQLVRAAES